MSTQVDNRVVEMTFDNAKFEKNVKQSMDSIKKLDEDLKILENASYLKNLDQSIKNFSLDSIANGIDKLNDRFSVMGIIGMTTIANLTNSALNFGKKITNNVLSQMKTGGMNRALNIEQAKFQLKGLGMDVEAVMEDVNYAVDGTAYGLDAAAKTASQFGASGVKAGEDMKTALRGVSGVAAMTGAQYEDIGRIFATVAGNGRVMGDQLNQISSRGINAAAALGKYLGVSESEVRKMTSKGAIDFQTFANAMDYAFGEHAKDANNTFTGALSNMKAAMSRIGADFSTPYINNMKDVFNAVRPWLNNLRTALKPIATDAENVMIGMNKRIVKALGDDDWVEAQTNGVEIFRNSLKGLLTIFAPISKAWKEVFPNSAAKTIKDFSTSVKDFTAKLGLNSRAMVNLRDTFKGLFSILKVVGNIFGTLLNFIFPFTDGANGLLGVILELTGALGRLVTAGVDVFNEFGGVSRIFTSIKNAAFGFFSVIVYGIGYLYDFASKSKLVQAGITGIKLALVGLIIGFALIIQQIQKLWNTDPSVFFKKLKNNILDFISGVKNLETVQVIMSAFSTFLNKIGVNIDKAREKFKNFVETIKNITKDTKEAFETDGILGFFGSIGNSIKNLMSNLKEFKKQGGLFGGLIESDSLLKTTGDKLNTFSKIVKEFISSLTPGKVAAFAFSLAIVSMAFSINKGVKTLSGLAGSVKGFFGSLTNAIKGIKKPKTKLQQFAEAIAILSASLVALTLVDSDKLNNAAKAIGILVAEMAGIGVIFSILDKFKINTRNFAVASRAMENLAISVGILTLSLLTMNHLDMNGIGQKLLVMLGVMVSLATVATLMGKFAPKLTKGSIFMLAFSLATANVIKALAKLESVNLEDMGDRITALFVVMTGLAILAKGVGSIRLTSVVGLYALVTVLNYALPTIKEVLSSVNIGEIQRRIEDSIFMLVALSGLAVLMGSAFNKIGSGIKKFGIGLLALSGAIVILSQVSKIFKKTDLSDDVFIKAGVFVAGALVLFSLIIKASGSDAGKYAVKLGVMALGISVAVLLLAQVSKSFAKMEIGNWFKAIIAIDSMLALFAIIITTTKYANKVNTKVLTAAILGVVVLMGELIVMTLIPMNEIAVAAGSMALVLLAFSKSLELIAKAKINVDGIMTMISMAVIVGEFAIILQSISNLPWEGLLSASVSIGIVMLAFTDVVKMISSRTGLKQEKLKNLLIIAISMIPLASAIAVLAQNPWNQILAAGASMSAVMYMFTAMLEKIAPKTGLKVDKINQVVKMTVAMLPMGIALGMLAQNPWNQILASAVGMSLALVAISGALSILGKISSGKDILMVSGGIIATAGAMIIMAQAIRQLEGINWESIGKAGAILGGLTLILGILAGVSAAFPMFGAFLIVIAEAFTLLGTSLLLAGTGITLAGVGLNILIPALQMIGNLDLQTISSGLITLAGALSLLSLTGIPMMILAGAFSVIGVGLMAAGSGIMIAGFGLNVLVPALESISSLDIVSIGNGLTELAKGLILVGLAGTPLLLVSTAFAIFGAALLVAGIGIMSAGVGLNILVPALQGLVGIDLVTIAQGMVPLAGGIALLGLAGTTMLIGAPGLMAGSLALMVLSPALNLLQTIDMITIGQGLLTLSGGVTTLGLASILLTAGAPGILIAGVGLISLATGTMMFTGIDLNVISEGLLNIAKSGIFMLLAGPGFVTAGAGILVLSSAIGIYSTSFALAMPLIETSFTTTMASLSVSASQAGMDAVLGLVNPIMAGFPLIMQAGIGMANSLLNGIREAGGWHSPWTETEQAGYDADAGLIQGMAEGAPQVAATSAEIAEKGIVGIFKKAIEKVKAFFKSLGADVKQFASEAGIDIDGIGFSFEDIEKKLKEFTGNTSEAGMEIDDLSKYFEEFAKSVGLAGDEEEKTNSETEKLAANLADLGIDLGKSGGKMDDLSDIEEDLSLETEDLSSNMDDLSNSLDSVASSAEQVETPLQKLTNTIANQLDIFSQFNMGEEISGEEMLDNMKSQIKGVTKWSDNLKKLAKKGLNKDLIKQLTDMGPQGYAKVAAFADMSAKEIKKANSLYAKSLKLPESTAKSIAKSFEQSGIATSLGFANGMDVHAGDQNATAMGENALNSLNGSLDIHSPSGETMKTAMNMCLGLSIGIQNNGDLVIDPIQSLVKKILNEFNTNLKKSVFEKIGSNIISGLSEGILDGESIVTTGITKVMKNTIDVAKKSLEVHSPSKVFMKIGKFITEGLALGILNNGSMVYRETNDVTNNLLDQFNGITKSIFMLFNQDLDMNPVIKPTLDLSNLIAGVEQINGMFESERLHIGGSFVSDEEGFGHNGDLIFNQYNNSPKALSAIDIYRQTKNLISMAKG